MRSTPKSRKLAKKIGRKLSVGRSTEVHKVATDYDRRDNQKAVEEGLKDRPRHKNLGSNFDDFLREESRMELLKETSLSSEVKTAMDTLGLDLIPAEWVRVHFQCPYCGAKQTIKLSELKNTTFVCDECDHLENFMELGGISL
jgi:predicted RNA-binding Zn-ribbon protein involved in translation (DUF1610 family)